MDTDLGTSTTTGSPEGNGDPAAPAMRRRLPVPPDGPSQVAREQFAEMLEEAFQRKERFPQFLRRVITNEWQITPEDFRSLIIYNLDDKLKKWRKRAGDNPDSLPHAIQRYLQERPLLSLSCDASQEAKSHPVVPSPNTIANWMEGKSSPDGSQIVLLAGAFDLNVRQEHMLWKSIQGRPLPMQQVVQTLHNGHSGALFALLVRSSGFTHERLAELAGVSKALITRWANSRSEIHNQQDIDIAGRLAKILTQCLDENASEIKTWRLAALQRDVTSLIIGKNLKARPASAKDAAAQFQLAFEDAFTQGVNFSQFLEQLLHKWDVKSKCLEFINENNAANPDVKDPPFSVDTFNLWVTGRAKPHNKGIQKLVSGTFMSEEQEIMIWKMVHGNPISAEDIRTELASGNSARVLNRLMEASGIAHERLLTLLDPNVNQQSNLMTWRNEDKPYRITNMQVARRLAALLLPHVTWDTMPPPPNQVKALQDGVVEILTGKPLTKSLYEMVVESLDHQSPKGRLIQLLTEKSEKSHGDIADNLGISKKVLSCLKAGDRSCDEAMALKFIEAAGGGAPEEITEAVNLLTETRSSSEMLRLAEEGKIWVGAICEETRTRRQGTRKDIEDRHGVKKGIVEAFERNTRDKAIELPQAQSIADYIGFKGEEWRRFVVMSTKHPLESSATIAHDAETLQCNEQQTLERMCIQTGLSFDQIGQQSGIAATDLANYCAGKTAQIDFPPGSLETIIRLCGVADDSPDMRRLFAIFKPNPVRLMQLACAGWKDRYDVLRQLLEKASLDTETQQDIGIAAGCDPDFRALQAQGRLAPVLAVAGERLHLLPSEIEWLQAMYAPDFAHDDDKAFVEHMESYRKRIIGEMMGGAMGHAVTRHRIYHDNTSYLSVFDAFAETVSNRDAKSALHSVRYFLTHDTSAETIDNIMLENIFRVTATHIGNASAPDGMECDRKEWQSELFDAVNKLLFQKLTRCRQRLGMGDIATSAAEAREQKWGLLADSEGRAVLTAVMATNNRMIARLARKLLEMPQYKQDPDAGDHLLKELWLGKDSTHDDRITARGGLEVFLRWNPAIAKLSTYMEKPIYWHIAKLLREMKDTKEISGTLDAPEEENGEKRANKLDDEAYKRYAQAQKQDTSDPEEVDDLMGKVERAIALLPVRENALLKAIFEGIKEGHAPTLEEMIPVVVAASQTETLTRERIRQLRVSAYNKFKDAWEIIAPDDPMPVALEHFLENMQDLRSAVSDKPGRTATAESASWRNKLRPAGPQSVFDDMGDAPNKTIGGRH